MRVSLHRRGKGYDLARLSTYLIRVNQHLQPYKEALTKGVFLRGAARVSVLG